MQQEAAVQLLESLVKTRRASKESLQEARRRLLELKEIAPSTSESGQLPAEAKTEKPVDPLLSRDLMRQIDDCQRRLARVCNLMHDIPKDVPCPEIMAEAMQIKDEEEDLWSKYRYLERNGRLPEETQKEEKLSQERSYELLAAVDAKKKLSEKRSKLRKKIADPKNLRNKLLDQWKDDLAQVEMDYHHYDELVKILKSR